VVLFTFYNILVSFNYDEDCSNCEETTDKVLRRKRYLIKERIGRNMSIETLANFDPFISKQVYKLPLLQQLYFIFDQLKAGIVNQDAM